MNHIKSSTFTAVNKITSEKFELVGFRSEPYKTVSGLWATKSGNLGRTISLHDSEEEAHEAQVAFVEKRYQQQIKAIYRKEYK